MEEARVTATLVVLEKNADQNFGSHEFKNCCHLQHIVTSTHADMHVNNHYIVGRAVCKWGATNDLFLKKKLMIN
jgi:hypothetical protein